MLCGIQVRCEDTGHPDWLSLYSPLGWVLRADNILARLREMIRQLAANSGGRIRYTIPKI